MDEAGYLRFSEQIDLFYSELLSITIDYLRDRNIVYDDVILHEVFQYQQSRVPNYRPINRKEIQFSYNIPEYFACFTKDKKIEVKKTAQLMQLDNPKDFRGNKTEFAKHIVWFGRKDKGIVHPVTWKNLEQKLGIM